MKPYWAQKVATTRMAPPEYKRYLRMVFSCSRLKK